jgi:hypothetical protein
MEKALEKKAGKSDSTFVEDKQIFPENKTEAIHETEESTHEGRSFMELYEESLQTIQEGKVVREKSFRLTRNSFWSISVTNPKGKFEPLSFLIWRAG